MKTSLFARRAVRAALAALLAACGARTGLSSDEERSDDGGADSDGASSDARGDSSVEDATVADVLSRLDVHAGEDADAQALCVCALAKTSITPGAACAAADDTSSLGCEFWPTSLGNPELMHPLFDAAHFAISVSNPGPAAADFEVIGPCGPITRQTVAAGASVPVTLPWIDTLKFLSDVNAQDLGTTADTDRGTRSVHQACGSYRVLSTQPVAVVQWNPFEGGVNAHSNDASRLRPTSSLGQHYRLAGYPVRAGEPPNGSYVAITGVADGTQVTIKLGPRGSIRAGDGVGAVSFGGTASFGLNLGDVLELLVSGDSPSDFNGTTIDTSKPVEIFTGHPCALNPAPQVWCDHLEESLAPVERLGDHYVVPVPSHPLVGHPPGGHSVILVGAFDGTDLVYAPAAPAGAPSHLQAGDVVDLARVTFDFDVQATQPFVLLTMMWGSAQLDTDTYEGDPSFGVPHSTREFRTRYTFLTAPGYDTSFADVVTPVGAALLLDGAPASAQTSPIAGTGFAVQRLLIGAGPHVLTSPVPIAVQVRGYANAESYDYPASGSN
jgi:hypothetical protein